MQLIFRAHSNSATKHFRRNFLQQIEKVLYLYSFWLRGHSSTTESEEENSRVQFSVQNGFIAISASSKHPFKRRLSGPKSH